MKKFKTFIHTCEKSLEERWQKLPDKKQRKLVALFFGGYLLITGVVILSVWYDARSVPQLEHINSPLLRKKKTGLHTGDSSTTYLKNKEYERK